METRGGAALEANRACSFSLKSISPLSPILHTCLTLEKSTRQLRHRLSVWESYGEVEQQRNFGVHIKLMKHVYASDISELEL